MRRGFTLIELLVVMTVIAILATIALFAIGQAQAAARDVKREQIMTGLQATLNRYYGDNNASYPASTFCTMINALKSGNYIPDFPTDPNGTKLCETTPNGDVSLTDTSIQYIYTGGSAYKLTLWKESGGSNDFESPK